MFLFLILIIFCSFHFKPACGILNLYVNEVESERLTGAKNPIYYVQNGFIDNYPLKFTVPMIPTISHLHFNWQSLTHHPIPYSIALSFNESIDGINSPTINISRQGYVPNKEQIFRLDVPCNGLVATDTHFFININLTLYPNNVTTLTLSRKRICRKGLSHKLPLEGVEMLAGKAKIVHTNIIIIGALVSVFCLSVVISIILYCFSICRKKYDEKPIYNGTSSQISSRPAQSLLKLEGHVNDVDTISRQESLYASCKFSEISSPVFCAIPTPRSSANTLIVPPILPDNVIINYCQV